MRISSFVSFFGFVLLIAGTFSPLLRPFHLFSWDVYALNKPYGIVILVIAVAGGISAILQQRGMAKIAAIISLVLVALLYVAAIMKVNSSFSFLPFKGISSAMSRAIQFKWGWVVLFAGALIAVVGSLTDKPPVVITRPVEKV
jgi:hypothetical protein